MTRRLAHSEDEGEGSAREGRLSNTCHCQHMRNHSLELALIKDGQQLFVDQAVKASHKASNLFPCQTCRLLVVSAAESYPR